MHYRLFDLWRFGAAILIMVYHYLFFAPMALWDVVGPFAQRPQGLLDLFFMISGFLVMSRHGETMRGWSDWLGFLRRRLATLYPLHLLTLCLFVPPALAGALGWMTFNEAAHWSLRELPSHLLLLHAWGLSPSLAFNFPSWSLSAEMFCYLLFPALLAVHRRLGAGGLAALLCGWIAALETLGALGWLGPEPWSRANTFGAFRALVGFAAGMLVAVAVKRLAFAPRSLWPAQALLLGAFLAMQMDAPPVLSLAILGSALFAAASAETARPRLTAALEPWSPVLRLSFGVYLWHMVSAGFFYQFAWNRFLPDAGPLAFAAFSILPVASSLALAALSAPFQRRAYRALVRRAPPAHRMAASAPA